MDPELTDEQRKEIEDKIREELQAKMAEENEDIINKIAEERLSKMKENMDKMDAKVQSMLSEKVKAEEKLKDMERKRLEDEGKHLELAEMKNSELKEKLKYMEEKLTGMTRDDTVNKAIASLEFRNDFARETAFNTIVNQLAQDEEGNWKHKSGASIEDYIKVFVKDDRHDILFKPKENSGAGSKPSNAGKGKSIKTDISKMSTQELLEAAEAGTLGEFSL